jgi:hypothetical protein
MDEKENAIIFAVDYCHPLSVSRHAEDLTLMLSDYRIGNWYLVNGKSDAAVMQVTLVQSEDVTVLSVIDYRMHLNATNDGWNFLKMAVGQTIDLKQHLYILMLNCVHNL